MLRTSVMRLQRGLSTSAPASSSLKDMFYNDEQKALQETVHKVLEETVNPFAVEWDKKEIFPAHEVFKAFGQAGLLGINKPVEYGGQGLSYKYQLAFIEAMGNSASPSVGMAVGVQTDCSTPALARFGSKELCKTYLEPAIAGDMVTSIAVSEPGGGSDVASLKTTAKKDGDDYVINGSKMWITNSLQADWLCLLANTSDDKPHVNKSLIIVPTDVKGITKTKIDKMGMRASDTGILTFEDVRVPQKNLIGSEGDGFTYQMIQFQEERLAAAGSAAESLERVIQETIEYTQERQAFGKPLIKNQYIAYKLAELATEVELLRAGTYQAVETMERGDNVTLLASMLKLKSGRLAREVCDNCLQFWGGMGFTEEVLVSRLYRDLRLFSIGGGADEVMLGIICKLRGITASSK